MNRITGLALALLLATISVGNAQNPTPVYDSVTILGAGLITPGQWTTATRPTSPAMGAFGFNVTTGLQESWNGTGWSSGGGSGGSVSTVSVVAANGFAGTVAAATTTPAITLTTTVTGLLKGNGTAISAASAGADFLSPTLPGGDILVGNGSNVATAVAMSGDATITNAGVASVNSLSHVTNASLANSGLVNASITFGGQGAVALGGSIAVRGTGAYLQAAATSTPTAGHCAQFDSNLNIADAGGTCTTGGGGGTVSAGTLNDLAYYAASGTAVTGLATINNGILVTSGTGVPSISTTAPSGLTIPSPVVTTAFTATGLVTLADLATQAANTVLVNATGGAASPTAQAIGSCSTAGNALEWTSNTGFGCNTAITAAAAPVSGLTGAGTGVLTALGNNVTGSGGIVLATSPSVSGLTVTGSLTATGLVTNADLASASTTVNGQICPLGGTCTITASAGTVTVGSTTIAGGTSPYLLYVNGTTLGNVAVGALSIATTQLTGALAAAQEPAHTGDATNTAGSLALTLATVNSGSGSVGSSTAIPVLTTNGKGLVTAQSTAAVVAPAGTLTGTALASGVTSSSLTSAAGGSFGTAAYDATGTTGATIPLNNGGFTQSGNSFFGPSASYEIASTNTGTAQRGLQYNLQASWLPASISGGQRSYMGYTEIDNMGLSSRTTGPVDYWNDFVIADAMFITTGSGLANSHGTGRFIEMTFPNGLGDGCNGGPATGGVCNSAGGGKNVAWNGNPANLNPNYQEFTQLTAVAEFGSPGMYSESIASYNYDYCVTATAMCTTGSTAYAARVNAFSAVIYKNHPGNEYDTWAFVAGSEGTQQTTYAPSAAFVAVGAWLHGIDFSNVTNVPGFVSLELTNNNYIADDLGDVYFGVNNTQVAVLQATSVVFDVPVVVPSLPTGTIAGAACFTSAGELIYAVGVDCYSGSGGGGVTSFNTRTGAVTLTGSDVTGVGGFLTSGGTVTGATTFSLAGSSPPALQVTSSGYGAFLYADTAVLHNPLATNYGGVGYDAHLAPALSVPMGNGSGYLSTTLVAGSGISLTQNTSTLPYTMTIASTGAGTFTGGTITGATTVTASGLAFTVNNNAEFQSIVYLSSAGISGTAILGNVSNTIQLYYASTLLASFNTTNGAVFSVPISYAGTLPTGIASTYACFTSGGELISSASPC